MPSGRKSLKTVMTEKQIITFAPFFSGQPVLREAVDWRLQ
jgi:hypothetical protein